MPGRPGRWGWGGSLEWALARAKPPSTSVKVTDARIWCFSARSSDGPTRTWSVRATPGSSVARTIARWIVSVLALPCRGFLPSDSVTSPAQAHAARPGCTAPRDQWCRTPAVRALPCLRRFGVVVFNPVRWGFSERALGRRRGGGPAARGGGRGYRIGDRVGLDRLAGGEEQLSVGGRRRRGVTPGVVWVTTGWPVWGFSP